LITVFIMAVFLVPMAMSVIALFLYPSSVNLFLKRWSPRNKFYIIFLKYWAIGPYMHTPYGAGIRRDAGINDPIWKDLVAFATITLVLVMTIKILTR